MTELPPAFCEEMRSLWQESDAPGEVGDFFAAFSASPSHALLLNLHKQQALECLREELGELVGVPWCSCGYFLEDNRSASLSASYRLGFYYLQDPSAMLPAELAAIRPGERVLDLCAAPGGKAFRAALELRGEGLLWANELSRKRARVLCRNLELGGFSNTLITAEDGRKLGERLAAAFDLVLLDAPCSGSAMFRKDRRALRSWEKFRGDELLRTQAELLDAGAAALSPGGRMVYSTCSFSWDEDEGQIQAFLERHPDFSLRPARAGGSSAGLSKASFDASFCCRLWPHLQRAEGQFAALLQKEGERPLPALPEAERREMAGREERAAWQLFLRENLREEAERQFQDAARLRSREDELHYLPAETGLLRGTFYLKSGLFLGQMKRKRKNGLEFRPSHSLLRSLPASLLRYCLDIKAGPLLASALRGETVTAEALEAAVERGEAEKTALEKFWQCPEGCRGALAFRGEALAWLKRQGKIFKNEQPQGWIPEEGE